jgi:hypothetical protein
LQAVEKLAIIGTAAAPCRRPAATRLIAPDRTSPAANTPALSRWQKPT